MAERIEYPQELQGETEERILQIHRYLRKMVEQLNSNQEITDENLSEYIATQMDAVRKIRGTKNPGSGSTEIRDLTAELVRILQEMLQDLQHTAQDTVTTAGFASLFVEKARATPISIETGGASKTIAAWLRELKEGAGEQAGETGKIKDETGETIGGSWHGFLYSGEVGRDINDDPIYGTAIGKDVVTWDSQGTPTYDPSKAWAIFAENMNKSGGTGSGKRIATAEELDQKEDLIAGTGSITNADSYDASKTGKWMITIGSGHTNFPAEITNGTKILMDVISGNGIVFQRIWTGNGRIYTRSGEGTGWGGWYKFSGTAL